MCIDHKCGRNVTFKRRGGGWNGIGGSFFFWWGERCQFKGGRWGYLWSRSRIPGGIPPLNWDGLLDLNMLNASFSTYLLPAKLHFLFRNLANEGHAMWFMMNHSPRIPKKSGFVQLNLQERGTLQGDCPGTIAVMGGTCAEKDQDKRGVINLFAQFCPGKPKQGKGPVEYKGASETENQGLVRWGQTVGKHIYWYCIISRKPPTWQGFQWGNAPHHRRPQNGLWAFLLVFQAQITPNFPWFAPYQGHFLLFNRIAPTRIMYSRAVVWLFSIYPIDLQDHVLAFCASSGVASWMFTYIYIHIHTYLHGMVPQHAHIGSTRTTGTTRSSSTSPASKGCSSPPNTTTVECRATYMYISLWIRRTICKHKGVNNLHCNVTLKKMHFFSLRGIWKPKWKWFQGFWFEFKEHFKQHSPSNFH